MYMMYTNAKRTSSIETVLHSCSVRKAEDAQRLSNELRSLDYAGQYIPLIFDVRDHVSIHAAARIVEKGLAGENLTCLINNAGTSSQQRNTW